MPLLTLDFSPTQSMIYFDGFLDVLIFVEFAHPPLDLTVCCAPPDGLPALPEGDEDADVADDEDDERHHGGHDEVGPHLVVVRVQLVVGPVAAHHAQQGLVRGLVLESGCWESEKEGQTKMTKKNSLS